MKIKIIEESASTNSYVSSNLSLLSPPVFVMTLNQTAGRGQRGNSWESAPGENITGSLYHCPQGVEAIAQFAISEAVSLAVVESLRFFGLEAKVKWPNDIYVGDKKICGILIEHSLLGSRIMHSISGIGLNVNQKEFVSDAPNPVSMSLLTGRDYEIVEVAARLAACLEQFLAMAEDENQRAALHEKYMSALWRCDGANHPFLDSSSGKRFEARIVDVEPQGYLRLLNEDGATLRYAFKEVAFLLNRK